MTSFNGHGPLAQEAPKRLTGRELAAWAARASALTRICIGAAIASGELALVDHTPAQAARLLGVKTKQLQAVSSLSPAARATLINRRRVGGARFSDTMIDQLVERVGAVRVLASIDRLTLPQRVAAE